MYAYITLTPNPIYGYTKKGGRTNGRPLFGLDVYPTIGLAGHRRPLQPPIRFRHNRR